MTDEEKAEDYEMDCIADVYRDDVCTIPYAYSAQKLVQAYLDGLAEGRKECGKDIEVLTKENAELKSQIEKMKCCGNCKKQNSCIKHNNFIYPEMTNPINYGCNNLDKWEMIYD